MCVAAGAIAASVAGSAASSVISGALSDQGSSGAAGASQAGADQSAAVQRYIYDQNRADQADYRKIGNNALYQLGGGTLDLSNYFTAPYKASDLEMDPGYQFRLSEGMKALQNSAAARGGLLSGNALKGISRYSQDYASNEFQNAYNRYNSDRTNSFNRLAAVAGIGQTANANSAAGGQNYANSLSGIYQNNAANQGNAMLASANSRNSMYQGIGNAVGRGVNNYFSGNSGGGGGYYDYGGSPTYPSGDIGGFGLVTGGI